MAYHIAPPNKPMTLTIALDARGLSARRWAASFWLFIGFLLARLRIVVCK